jgi:hypothetical protein
LYFDNKPSLPVSSFPVSASDTVGSEKYPSKGVPAD